MIYPQYSKFTDIFSLNSGGNLLDIYLYMRTMWLRGIMAIQLSNGVWAATCACEIFAVAVAVTFLIVFRHRYGYALIRKKEKPQNSEENSKDCI